MIRFVLGVECMEITGVGEVCKFQYQMEVLVVGIQTRLIDLILILLQDEAETRQIPVTIKVIVEDPKLYITKVAEEELQ